MNIWEDHIIDRRNPLLEVAKQIVIIECLPRSFVIQLYQNLNVFFFCDWLYEHLERGRLSYHVNDRDEFNIVIAITTLRSQEWKLIIFDLQFLNFILSYPLDEWSPELYLVLLFKLSRASPIRVRVARFWLRLGQQSGNNEACCGKTFTVP